MGKAYANKKPKAERPESDYYPTPRSLTWLLCDLNVLSPDLPVVDPACGEHAITDALRERGFTAVDGYDLRYGQDFLTSDYSRYPQAVMNPPFSLFDAFVTRARQQFPVFATIMKTNFMSAHSRNAQGLWRGLRDLYVFDRQVDYRTPLRADGHFHVGALTSGWAVFDREWDNPWWRTHVVDVNRWATLGAVK